MRFRKVNAYIIRDQCNGCCKLNCVCVCVCVCVCARARACVCVFMCYVCTYTHKYIMDPCLHLEETNMITAA